MFLASEIPPGTGLGSSAAVCVNVLKALSTWLEVPLDRYELAERAFAMATERLGKPVGKQDEYAAAFGGLNLIRFSTAGVEVEPLGLSRVMLARLESSLLLFFTGSARDSAGILSEQRAASRRGAGEVLGALGEIKELFAESHAALLAGDIPRFGRLLDLGWQAKRRISPRISNPYIDRLYSRARAAGALGGKITGAAGGGFLTLCCEPEHHRAVRAAMAAEGAREMHFQLDLHGAHVVYNDPLFDAGGRGGMRWRFVPLEEVA